MMLYPAMKDLLAQVPSRYQLVNVVAHRARQIAAEAEDGGYPLSEKPVSLAIQGTLSNLAGGIQVLVSKPFKAGDYIETESISGTVSEIGLVYTKIKTYDNKIIMIPNGQVASAKITNYTAEERRRVDLKFNTSYDAPVELVKETIQSVIRSHPKALREPAPFARVSAYKDSSIEYAVRVWCATDDYWELYSDLMEQVKAAFDKNGIEMTYNHLNVHMKQE